MAYAAGFLFLAQLTVAAAQALPDSVAETPQVEMEKCFALPDARPKECAADPDSDECREAEQKGKDGTEFKYVPRGTCARLGGSPVMAQRPKPQK
jgi:uncharacterized membrane protein